MDTENICRICLKEFTDLSKLHKLEEYSGIIRNLTQVEVQKKYIIQVSTNILEGC